MDPEAFWLHGGVLFVMKQEVVKRGWLSDAQSSKKLKGEWKKVSTLGMHRTAKYSGARLPKFANVDLILPVCPSSLPRFNKHCLKMGNGKCIACSILAITYTFCDVERSFSIWKHVRADKQQSTAEGTHKADVFFCFNGLVPPP